MSVYPVISDHMLYDSWCLPSSIESFKQAISRRELSPYSRDEAGRTFLHSAAIWHNVELCSLLIQLGIDPNQRDDWGNKALHYLSVVSHNRENDTLRILTRNCDVEVEDLYHVFSPWYQGTASAADLLLSTYGLSIGSGRLSSHLLAVALQNLGSGRREWRTWLLRLLRKKIDLHSVFYFSNPGPPNETTTLDYLFLEQKDPSERKEAAKEWLSILVEAGYDVHKYLEKEKRIYSRRNGLLDRRGVNADRQLIFGTSGEASVHWKWYFPFDCPGWLICQEFCNINPIKYGLMSMCFHCWVYTWPFEYAAWSEIQRPRQPIFPIENYARSVKKWQENALNKWQINADNAARRHTRQAWKKYPEHFENPGQRSAIPGAWVDDH